MSLSTRRLLATLTCAALLSGCSLSPVGVKRMDARTVHRELTANVLTAATPSIPTRNVLYQRDLFVRFEKDPVGALAELHRQAVAANDSDAYFALAELSFLHAERAKQRSYSIAAAIYAWSFLFGGEPPDPFDPRLRVATDLYNRGLTMGLEEGQKHGLVLDGRSFDLPFGRLHLSFDSSSLEWHGRHLRDFVPVAELEVRGLDNRFRTPGIGAPLAADASVSDPAHSDDFLARRLKISTTALLRIDDIRQQIARGDIYATLELHTDPNEGAVEIDGQRVPLEKEPTAVIAAMLADAPILEQEIKAFLGILIRTGNRSGLAALRPHTRGRIPVVFVHGTASSPARWAEMVNVLDNDPRLNTRFEPWFFTYDSSSPIIYSAYLLRKALQQAVRRLDPAGTDPGLHDMVVVGHSQGGLLTKMTVVSSGNRFWENLTSTPFDEVNLKDEDRELLSQVMFVEPLPFVRRVVFICTPHRGSFLAAKDWVRKLITRLVTLPIRVTQVTADMLTMNPEMAAATSGRSITAVDNMSPGNSFIRTLADIPVAPGVAAHSIIAVQGTGPVEKGDDGVVRYTSAHIDGVESEKIVHSSHSTQAVPETIEEVRRILLEHAAAAP